MACGGPGAYRDARFRVGSEWASDRNTLYARLGRPDSTENKPARRTLEEGAGQADGYPFEIWHYDHLNGIGDNVELEFVDDCMCGDYQLSRPNPLIRRLLANEP